MKLPPLTPNPTKATTCVYEGFALFVTVRAITDAPGEAFPFTRSFAADWCGIDREPAKSGISSLLSAGVIVKVGSIPAGPYQANLYVIGVGRPQ